MDLSSLNGWNIDTGGINLWAWLLDIAFTTDPSGFLDESGYNVVVISNYPVPV